jgi:uncharacterized protein (TIGR02302 family)
LTEPNNPEHGFTHARAHVLARALRRARMVLLWEQLWPALAAVATAGGLFLALSWLGLWISLRPLGRAIGLLIFVILAVAATVPLFRIRWPSRTAGLRRLDRESLLPHRPATAIADTMAPEAGDQYAVALWRAHLERALLKARALKAGRPLPKLALRDPMALRGLVLILVIAGFVTAGSDRTRRIAAAFDWHGVIGSANYRIDAWVTPPAYTGRPPLILPGLHPNAEAAMQPRASGPVTVPAGSILVVRATGDSGLDVAVSGGLAETKAEAGPQAPKGTEERHFTISATGKATVRGGSEDVSWSFNAIPDRPPVISLTKEPEPQLRGSLMLQYKLEDDYGVVDAQATFERKPVPAAPGAKEPRPLYNAPDFALALPQARTRSGVGQTSKDLSEHPWAGTDVTLTLTARDEANNEARSTPHEMRLPERPFAKPLPRALIEQRRNLALDANAKDRVLTALDALAIAPERFIPEAAVYLGLRSIYWQLVHAENDDSLRDVVARLWAMAVQLEDGNISDTEKQLRAAQDALREALERGAPDEEIKKLMDDLRAALDKFMQALAEQLRKNPQAARPFDPNSMRALRSQDLRNMLDRMEQLARSGARDAAKQLLSQLQQMLDNLQMAQPNGDMGDGDDMQQALDELGDMIRKQQQLRDRTFRQGQDQRRQQRGQQRGQQGGRNQMGELRQDQQALREQLNKLLQELRKKGFPQQGEDGQQGQQGQQGEGEQLGQAGEAMGDAAGSLGDGDADGAVDSQGRALEALRKGAQGLAQSMQQQFGQGPGPGQPGRIGQGRANQDTDPLGRPLRGRDYGDDTTVKVPREIDVQRARRIIDELRKRFGESYRPQLELDYIERLLKDY